MDEWVRQRKDLLQLLFLTFLRGTLGWTIMSSLWFIDSGDFQQTATAAEGVLTCPAVLISTSTPENPIAAQRENRREKYERAEEKEIRWQFRPWWKSVRSLMRDFDDLINDSFPGILESPSLAQVDRLVKVILGMDNSVGFDGPRLFQIEKLNEPEEVNPNRQKQRILIGRGKFFLEVEFPSFHEAIEFDVDVASSREWPEVWISQRLPGVRSIHVGKISSLDGTELLLRLSKQLLFRQPNLLEILSELYPDFRRIYSEEGGSRRRYGQLILNGISGSDLRSREVVYAVTESASASDRTIHLFADPMALGRMVRRLQAQANDQQALVSSQGVLQSRQFNIGSMSLTVRSVYPGVLPMLSYLQIRVLVGQAWPSMRLSSEMGDLQTLFDSVSQ